MIDPLVPEDCLISVELLRVNCLEMAIALCPKAKAEHIVEVAGLFSAFVLPTFVPDNGTGAQIIKLVEVDLT